MKIRATRPDELNAVAAFLTDGGMPHTAATLRWKFWDSPGRLNGCGKSIVAEIDGRIVGHIGIMPATVHLDSPGASGVPGGWFVDWVVRRDLRSRGIGIFLLREAEKTCRALMTIQGTADTRQALPALQWVRQDGLSVFKLNVRAGGTCEEAGLGRRVATELARVVRYHPVRWPAPEGWSVTLAGESPAADPWHELDAVLARQHQSLNGAFCHFDRSAEALRWLFMAHPAGHYRLTIARDAAGPAGYIIWRTCRDSGHRIDGRIVDILAPWERPDAWRWLVSVAVARLAAQGVVQISCLAGADSVLGDALRVNRFLSRQDLPLWISPLAAEFCIPRRWHVTFADSDIDTASRE
ncbi:MAG TPA: GNAT family N-acetyltransferase [Phycisphaerae bacterium]|nr:GNAT family N-acetyltransferase [Phycisphaerae bacterium]HRR85194.1 GNAT family N-acetyltransferase [Phycisphaerae bacterium]